MTLRKLSLVLAAAALLSAQADVALQRAIRTETLEGDMNGAIEQYGKLAESSDRAIAAQALVRMAGCYEKLGTAQARTIYERVVSEFADQPESVTTARVRLAALQPAEQSVSARQIWARPLINGGVSADGRFVTFTDWTKGGDLAVRDLVAGTTRLLTDREEVSGPYADGSVISPDGRSVAYLWVEAREQGPWDFQVRIVPMDGDADPRIVYHNHAQYVSVESWTPDGQNLLIVRGLADGHALDTGWIRPATQNVPVGGRSRTHFTQRALYRLRCSG
jgi:hypothetical protein